MDGVAGLEPAHDRIKIYWLTNLPIPHLQDKIFSDLLIRNQEIRLLTRWVIYSLPMSSKEAPMFLMAFS